MLLFPVLCISSSGSIALCRNGCIVLCFESETYLAVNPDYKDGIDRCRPAGNQNKDMIIWIWIPRLPDHAVLQEKTAPWIQYP